jgi:hypothetical protein
MKPDKMEQTLNKVISELCNGLAGLAEKVRCGASREELANAMEAMAGEICEHWPHCFTELMAKKKGPLKCKPPKGKSPKAKSPKAKA